MYRVFSQGIDRVKVFGELGGRLIVVFGDVTLDRGGEVDGVTLAERDF